MRAAVAFAGWSTAESYRWLLHLVLLTFLRPAVARSSGCLMPVSVSSAFPARLTENAALLSFAEWLAYLTCPRYPYQLFGTSPLG